MRRKRVWLARVWRDLVSVTIESANFGGFLEGKKSQANPTKLRPQELHGILLSLAVV